MWWQRSSARRCAMTDTTLGSYVPSDERPTTPIRLVVAERDALLAFVQRVALGQEENDLEDFAAEARALVGK